LGEKCSHGRRGDEGIRKKGFKNGERVKPPQLLGSKKLAAGEKETTDTLENDVEGTPRKQEKENWDQKRYERNTGRGKEGNYATGKEDNHVFHVEARRLWARGVRLIKGTLKKGISCGGGER